MSDATSKIKRMVLFLLGSLHKHCQSFGFEGFPTGVHTAVLPHFSTRVTDSRKNCLHHVEKRDSNRELNHFQAN